MVLVSSKALFFYTGGRSEHCSVEEEKKPPSMSAENLAFLLKRLHLVSVKMNNAPKPSLSLAIRYTLHPIVTICGLFVKYGISWRSSIVQVLLEGENVSAVRICIPLASTPPTTTSISPEGVLMLVQEWPFRGTTILPTFCHFRTSGISYC